jgi:membrane associated rhomboid family serine protease
MIFPILNGLLSWRKAPVAWALVALNILVLIYTSYAGQEAQAGLEELMKGKFFLSAQGRIYAQYVVNQRRQEYPPFLRELASKVDSGEVVRAEMLGQLAFRDLGFIKNADSVAYQGDQVAFRYWRQKLEDVRDFQGAHPSFNLGLNAEDASFSKWITYIFVHSGTLHLLGNMLFLALFGAALEVQIGGLGLLIVFLLSGVMAAGSFALMTGVTSSPLVGASGAVSGIMALYCMINWTRSERYFYWFFLPFRGFMGFVFLPAWVALILWAINDVSGYLGTLPELGGVAYTAHLGGEVAGVMVGTILYILRRKWPLVHRNDQNVPVGKLFPWLAPIYDRTVYADPDLALKRITD